MGMVMSVEVIATKILEIRGRVKISRGFQRILCLY